MSTPTLQMRVLRVDVRFDLATRLRTFHALVELAGQTTEMQVSEEMADQILSSSDEAAAQTTHAAAPVAHTRTPARKPPPVHEEPDPLDGVEEEGASLEPNDNGGFTYQPGKLKMNDMPFNQPVPSERVDLTRAPQGARPPRKISMDEMGNPVLDDEGVSLSLSEISGGDVDSDGLASV